MNILIVDDNETNLKLLRVTLESEGFKTIMADDGKAGLEKLQEGNIDAVVSDILMPNMDGYHFCQAVRDNPATKSIPFIFYTSTCLTPSDEKLAMEVGADRYLEKPAPAGVLKEALNQLLGEKSSRPNSSRSRLGAEHVLKEYNHILVKKLEEKNLELEAQNKKLIEAQEKFQELILNINQVFFISSGSKIVYVSPAYERIWGRSCESLYEDASSWADAIHPDDRLEIGGKLKGSVPGREQALDYRIVRPDGTVRWIRAQTFPVHGNATAGRIVGIAEDVTEQRLAERALKESEEQLNAFFNSSLVGMTIIDRDYRYLKVNGPLAEMNGLPIAEHAGKSVKEIIPNLAFTIEPLLKAVFESGEPVLSVELHGETPREPGIVRDWDGSFFPIKDGSGQVIAAGVVIVEMTEHRRLQEQFRQAQKMEAVGQLAGGIAHDFNNLLSVILGYSDFIIKGCKGGGAVPSLEEDIGEIKGAATRATTLTRQLLAFSRRQVLQPAIINLNDSIAGLEKMLRRVIGENIELISTLDPAIANVKVDPGQIEQVIMNLVINARDAMEKGGKLTIKTQNVTLDEGTLQKSFQVEPGPYVMMSVVDTGCGMDAQTKLRIFEPFFTTKEKGKGTGLGLSTVFGIVKQSGGYVTVDSEVNRGTEFRVFLPGVAEVAQATKVEEAPRDSTGTGAETVLVVEDDGKIRTMIKRILQSKSYKVIEAENGEQALAVLNRRKEAIHLMVTDILMPGISGIELAARVGVEYPETKVLFISGYTDQAAFREGIPEFKTNFLVKPFTAEVLVNKVREILESK
jgi:PAS domain S-box-containing protein